ncbi:hypothetical protein BS78_10G263800 [Paspalum vaginatum]|nr:hypothetical protein BS78_10G263800 [Paspalum vaginatum]
MLSPSNLKKKSSSSVHRRGAAAETPMTTIPNHHIQPNVIARLMGMDAAVVPPPPAAAAADAEAAVIVPNKPQQTRHRGSGSGSGREDFHFGTGDDDTSSSSRSCGLHRMRAVLVLPGRRPPLGSRQGQRVHHPQEELLRKMRQDLQRVDGSSCCVQAIAQEKLRREKMARYYGFVVVAGNHDGNSRKKKKKKNGRGINRGGLDAAAADDNKEKPAPAPTPIVLLRPSAAHAQQESGQRGAVFRRSLPSLLAVDSSRDGDTSRLLKEVKQRLQIQLKVNAAVATAADLRIESVACCRGGGAEAGPTPQIAREAEEEEDAHAHHGGNNRRSLRLSRSESFRAVWRSDRRVAASASAAGAVSPPEKGSLADDASSAPPLSESLSDSGGQSFRSDGCLLVKHDTPINMSPASPRALVRSLSAPEWASSSSSLGSRLFAFGGGDRRTRRSTEHSASQAAAAAAGTSSKSSSFSFITGRVSSLMRRSFGGLGTRTKMHYWWLNKKTSLGVGDGELHLHPQVGTATGATPPPSSPRSPSRRVDVDPQSFAERSPRPSQTRIPAETARDPDKAYIRELLTAAGLYHYHHDDRDRVARRRLGPICDSVFEEVEDIYYFDGRVSETATDHRMLFDLANEALQILEQRSSRPASSSLCQWVLIDTTTAGSSSSRGRELEDDVWHQVQALRMQDKEMQTIDSMVAHQVRKTVWAEVLHEHVYVVASKIERAIFDELVQDLVQGFPPNFFTLTTKPIFVSDHV